MILDVTFQEVSQGFGVNFGTFTYQPCGVLYTPQKLTEEQKAQARANIDACKTDEIIKEITLTQLQGITAINAEVTEMLFSEYGGEGIQVKHAGQNVLGFYETGDDYDVILRGIAPAEQPEDAVNKGQLDNAINGIKSQVYDIVEGIIDDSTIGNDAWSSKNTVDKLCPSFTESGAVVACEPLEGSEMDVVTQFYPIQEGTPSPDNVCPINGRTGGELWKGGKNLFDFKSGVSRVSLASSSTGRKESWGYAVTLPAGTYTFHAEVGSNSNGGYIYVAINDNGGNYLSNFQLVNQSAQGSKTVTLNDGDVVYVYNGQTSKTEAQSNELFNDGWNIQVELGTSSSAYEPYCGEEITIDFGQTVYGGTYNWTTGLLTIDMMSVVYDCTEGGWSVYQSGDSATVFQRFAPEMDTTRVSKLRCNKLPTSYPNAYYGRDNAIGLGSNGYIRMFIKDIEPTIDALNVWLTENELFVVYPMSAPITIQLTPQEMIALSCTNSLYSDMGNTTVSGRESINAVIERLTNAIIALGGNV